MCVTPFQKMWELETTDYQIATALLLSKIVKNKHKKLKNSVIQGN